MDMTASDASRERFEAYITAIVSVLGHADREEPLHDYCTGLLLPLERKSVEPLAAHTAPGRTGAKHQSLLHFVGNAGWSDEAVLSKVREIVLPRIEAHGAIEATIVDDTAFPKKGRHSVGVARQYCGPLGKQDNCQSVVSLSLANHHASLPIAHQLYLPEAWANDTQRRKTARVPANIRYQTKPDIALQQLQAAQAAGLDLGTVLTDPGYGYDSQFRQGVTDLGRPDVAGVQSNMLIWRADAVLPLQGTDGRKASRPQRRAKQVSAQALALGLRKKAWRMITWREDSEALTSRFARLRIRPVTEAEPPAEEWLLIEWPQDAAEPTKYWLSTLPEAISFETLVDQAKLRWRIERDYQELKQELGLGHYEGRGWRGLHHHVTLCIAAYGFLVAERALFSPARGPGSARSETSTLPAGRRSNRAAATLRATRAKLHHHTAPKACRGAGSSSATLPMLQHSDHDRSEMEFMTQ
jgi:SRSO17 transposase